MSDGRTHERTGLLAVLLGAALWGTWPLFVRPSGLGGPVNALVAFVVMTLPLPFVWRELPRVHAVDPVATGCLVAMGFADALNTATFFAAVSRGPLAVAEVTHYLAPVLLLVLAPRALGEAASRRVWVAAPAALAGLSLVVGLAPSARDLGTAALGATSAVAYAVLTLCAKRATRSYSPMAVVALHTPLSAVVLLVALGGRALPDAWDGNLARAALGALLCGLGGSVLVNVGLRRARATSAGLLTYLEPVVATVLGTLAFGEHLPARGWLGVLVVLAAGAFGALGSAPRGRMAS